MHRQTHKEKVGRKEFIQETNKKYFARLAHEKTTDAAAEAFRRPAYYGANIKKKEDK